MNPKFKVITLSAQRRLIHRVASKSLAKGSRNSYKLFRLSAILAWKI